MLVNRTCPYCGDELATLYAEHSGVCSKPSCQRERVNAQIKRASDERSQLIAKIKKELASKPQKPDIIALTPANTSNLVPLPQTRIAAFTLHLSTVISGEGEEELFPYSSAEFDEIDNRKEPAWINNACATCQGYCCRLGKNHAFLDKRTIDNILTKKPEHKEMQEIISLYSSYLPARSYEHSCVFQGEKGCSLPKKLRANTCNRFLCKEVKIIIEQSKSTKHGAIMYFSAIADGEIVRVSEPVKEE